MRARARWGITPLLAAPAGAWALGLGDIELQSALNQPFRAEIALSATAEELQGLRVILGRRRYVRALRPRSPGLSQQSRVSRRRRSQRPQRRPGHLARVDRRAVRDVARRGHLAARPNVARIHRAARSARYCCRARRPRRPCSPRKRAHRAATRPAARSIARPRRTGRRLRRRPRAGPRTVESRPSRACAELRASTPRAPGCRRRAASTVPCSEPRRCGRSPTDCVPTASRSIK